MGPWEIALILVIVLVVFGVGKMPQAFGAIGKGIRAFKRAESGEDEKEEETPGLNRRSLKSKRGKEEKASHSRQACV